MYFWTPANHFNTFSNFFYLHNVYVQHYIHFLCLYKTTENKHTDNIFSYGVPQAKPGIKLIIVRREIYIIIH